MKAIVTGDAEYVARSFDNLPPGAHVAVRTSPTQLPDSGIALRLAGFEIRDTIAHIVGDRIVWWVLARKPLDGTVAANVLAHGVGGLNIDASRVGSSAEDQSRREEWSRRYSEKVYVESEIYGNGMGAKLGNAHSAGRFPANVLLDEHAAAEMDKQSGVSVSRKIDGSKARPKVDTVAYGNYGTCPTIRGHEDSGGASRFFPVLNEDGAENWIRRLIDPDQSQ